MGNMTSDDGLVSPSSSGQCRINQDKSHNNSGNDEPATERDTLCFSTETTAKKDRSSGVTTKGV